MLDRALTFANPQVVSLIREKFVAVAIDQAYQRRQQDAEGEFYRKIAGQGPRKPGRGTTQGLYTADAEGRFLGFSNNRQPDRIVGLLQKSLREHRPGKTEALASGPPDARYNPKPPEGGFVVRVRSKVLDGYEETDDALRKIFQQSLGRDNLWIRADEHESLVKGVLPESLVSRIARYHLVDNTRGEPPMWDRPDVRAADVKLENGVIQGTVHLKNGGGDREFRVAFRGHVEVKAKQVVRFDLIARGDFRGEGRYTRGAPKGDFPFAIAFQMADGSDPADVIPPQGSRGWVAGYMR